MSVIQTETLNIDSNLKTRFRPKQNIHTEILEWAWNL